MKKDDRIINIKIADVVVGIWYRYDRFACMCKRYVTNEISRYECRVSDNDIMAEMIDRDDLQCLDYLETLAIYRKLTNILIAENIMIIHGSAICVDDGAYLFVAPSGTGKSTHTRLWREYFKDRAIMINDDKPLIRIKDGVTIHGTPWDGKHHLSNPIGVNLKGICVLEQGVENNIVKLTSKQSRIELMKQTYLVLDDHRNAKKSLELIDALLMMVPVYNMQCNISYDAVRLAYETMKEEKI